MVEKVRDYLPYLSIIIPFIAFLFVFYSEHTKLKADVQNFDDERVRIIEKLDRISEKINVIDGKISEHMRSER